MHGSNPLYELNNKLRFTFEAILKFTASGYYGNGLIRLNRISDAAVTWPLAGTVPYYPVIVIGLVRAGWWTCAVHSWRGCSVRSSLCCPPTQPTELGNANALTTIVYNIHKYGRKSRCLLFKKFKLEIAQELRTRWIKIITFCSYWVGLIELVIEIETPWLTDWVTDNQMTDKLIHRGAY